MVAKSIDGTVYKIAGLLHMPGLTASVGEKQEPKQQLTVTPCLKKNQIWQDPCQFMPVDLMNEYDYLTNWKLIQIINIDEKTKQLVFKKDNDTRATTAYKEVFMNLGLTADMLDGLIRHMFVHVFTPNMLQALLDADKLEYIIDDEWMYLKAGNTAYRV